MQRARRFAFVRDTENVEAGFDSLKQQMDLTCATSLGFRCWIMVGSHSS